jgi:hypothetical protein
MSGGQLILENATLTKEEIREEEQHLVEAGAFKGEDGYWYWPSEDALHSTLATDYESLLTDE